MPFLLIETLLFYYYLVGLNAIKIKCHGRIFKYFRTFERTERFNLSRNICTMG